MFQPNGISLQSVDVRLILENSEKFGPESLIQTQLDLRYLVY